MLQYRTKRPNKMNQSTWLKHIFFPTVLLASTITFSTAFAAKPSHLEHPHSKGTFMFEAMAMRMSMNGLRAGTSDVSTRDAHSPLGKHPEFRYGMVPKDMTMDMYMLMPMYNITKDLSTMLMINYLSNSMDMVAASDSTCTSTMETSGLGDTQLSLSYKFLDDSFAASMELSMPTGSIDEKSKMKMFMGGQCVTHNMFSPYAMQLGSGTYDVKPSLTYLGAYYTWRYGAQVSYKYRIGENDNGYTLGDKAMTKLWVRKPVSMVTLSGVIDIAKWGAIDGTDPSVPTKLMDGVTLGSPTAFSSNYGGTQVDFTIGASMPVSVVAVGLDLTLPVYQDLNGLQMKRSWTLAAAVSAMF